LPVEGDEEVKRTNEIGMAIPLLDPIDLQGKDITADALLTQRKLADYLCLERKAHYHFIVKGNQATLFEDIQLYFQDRDPKNLDNHRTQPLPRFPPCATSLLD
jgi:predicted transposase YbfD/YdcC